MKHSKGLTVWMVFLKRDYDAATFQAAFSSLFEKKSGRLLREPGDIFSLPLLSKRPVRWKKIRNDRTCKKNFVQAPPETNKSTIYLQ